MASRKEVIETHIQNRAVRIPQGLTPQEIRSRVNKIIDLASGQFGLHFETASIVVPEPIAQLVKAKGLAEDVTASAQVLDARQDGYRIVRQKAKKGAVIRDYKSGFLTQIDAEGRYVALFTKENEGAAFSGSNFGENCFPPFEFFESFDEARTAFMKLSEKTA